MTTGGEAGGLWGCEPRGTHSLQELEESRRQVLLSSPQKKRRPIFRPMTSRTAK